VADLVVDRPNQVWVSDITYIFVGAGFGYLFLLTDAYSRKIIGYAIEASLSAEGALKALKMALHQKQVAISIVYPILRATDRQNEMVTGPPERLIDFCSPSASTVAGVLYPND
jgi:transposase InsO family protein